MIGLSRILMQMSDDAFLNPLLIDGHVTIARGADWLVSPVNGLVSVALFAGVGVLLRRYRLRASSHVR